MGIKEEFDSLVEKLKTERDEITLKAHLATMEARKELEGAEKKWDQLREKASEIADDTIETSEEYIAKAKSWEKN
jgi:L-lactate utilization protein LutB